MLERAAAISKINELSEKKTPFFFFTDFHGSNAWIKPISEIDVSEIQFDFSGQSKDQTLPEFSFHKFPISQEQFGKSYQYVVDQINYGYSYLVNLTFKTPIRTDLSLTEIFNISRARYKLKFKEEFVVFSPETFVQIRDGYIYAYPMKGTINADIPNAENIILNDRKETAEHVTIVDLIRNDLSLIAEKVEVTRFRFITEVRTHEKRLLQVSSEIRGKLPAGYEAKMGEFLFQLIPAGSISGAPKPETLRIIASAETYSRGFYTGVCGFFDGKNLDSAVMIRFIEQEKGKLYYKSGGGITSFSDLTKEYQEIIDKIYIPI